MVSTLDQLRLKFTSGVIDPRLVVKAGYIQNVKTEQVQGNSIDLTIQSLYRINGGITLFRDSKRKLPEYILQTPNFPIWEDVQDAYSSDRMMYRLDPRDLYQVEFEQTVSLPASICGVTLIRSTMAKSGCSGENGLFDSGYEGSTGMMISVQFESFLEERSSIAQMMFFRAHAKKAEYSGFYQKSAGPKDWLASYGETIR